MSNVAIFCAYEDTTQKYQVGSLNEWKRKIRRRSVCVLLKVADIGCFQYSACVCQCLSIAGISEKSFPLTKGEAPDFETFVNTFFGKYSKIHAKT